METSAYEAGEAFGRSIVPLIMIGTFLVAGIFFVVALIKAINRKTPGWIVSTVLAGIVALVGLIGLVGVAAGPMAKKMKSAQEAGERKKRLSSPDGRARLEVPGSWKEMPELNEDAAISAANPAREQYVVVIENPKADYAGNLDEFDALVTGMIGEKLEKSELSEPENRKVGDYPARHRRLLGTTQNIRIVYHTASIETADAFYQVLTWTIPSRETTSLPVLREVIDSFNAGPAPSAESAAKPRIVSSDIRGRATELAAELLDLDPAEIKPGSRFVEDLDVEGSDAMEIVKEVGKEFGVSIADEEAEKMKTVDDLVLFLERQAAKPEAE